MELYAIMDVKSKSLKYRKDKNGKRNESKEMIRIYRTREKAEEYAEKLYRSEDVKVVKFVEV